MFISSEETFLIISWNAVFCALEVLY